MEELEFQTEMITLKDLLKVSQLLPSGGIAKAVIKDEGVIVNGEDCFSPGKKLYKGDWLIFDDYKITIV